MLKFKNQLTILCCMLLMLTCLSGCSGKQETQIQAKGKSYFSYFDTVSYVYSYAGDSEEQFNARSAGVSGILSEYHQLFDIYHEYSGVNNLYTINQAAGGDPVPVDKKLIDFLLYARELYENTRGEMNIAMGSVLKIWHDYRSAAESGDARVPSLEELNAAAEHMDISVLEIDEENLTVRLNDPNASLDVGALGKGYAVEKAAEYLIAEEAYGYVLNVGGNIRIIGEKPDGSGWNTGIRDPNHADGNFIMYLYLSDTSCVTSGNYERFYMADGVRYHHIIDQDSLFPADYFASVTVITQNSALADALSTALYCMTYEEGMELVKQFEDVQVLWVFEDGETRYTPGLADNIKTH